MYPVIQHAPAYVDEMTGIGYPIFQTKPSCIGGYIITIAPITRRRLPGAIYLGWVDIQTLRSQICSL